MVFRAANAVNDLQPFSRRVIVVFVVAVLHALYIGLGVNRAAVAEAAKSYARQLILSCETLMGKAKPVPAAAAKPKKP